MGRKLTARQVSEEFFDGTISRSHVYTLASQKKLPHMRLAGGRLIFDEDILTRFVEASMGVVEKEVELEIAVSTK